MEGRNRGGEHTSKTKGSETSKKGKRKSESVTSYQLPIPRELVSKVISQSTTSTAVSWETDSKQSASNSSTSTKPFGPSRPPPRSSSVSFGSLDWPALSQSGGIDYAAAAAAVNRASNVENMNMSEPDAKAMLSLLVEFTRISMDPDKSNASGRTKSAQQAAQNFVASASSGGSPFPVFMFGNTTEGAREIPAPPGGWPSSAAAATAAAAAGLIPADGESWGEYFEDEETDDEDEEDSIPDLDEVTENRRRKASSDSNRNPTKPTRNVEAENEFSHAALAALEQEELNDALQEEERARKAAKKREKKQRKKEKAKKEAALKASQAAQKKREKLVMSWRSRVVTACQSNEVTKLESLLGESPLKSQKTMEENEAETDEFLQNHLVFLLPNSIAKSRQQVEKGQEARLKLADFIVNCSIQVVFTIGRNGRTALHTACFYGDFYFVQLVLQHANKLQKEESSSLPESFSNILCEDSGWAPIHYAAVSGSMHVMESLLSGGCDVLASTDKSKTRRISNGDGITARELAEIVRSGKADKILETDGDALREMKDSHLDSSSSSERSRFLRVLEKVIARLSDVEKNGYTPPEEPATHSFGRKSQGDDEATLQRRSSSMDDVTKKKKKKKKKDKQQQSEPEPAKPAQKPVESDKREDPMITALLGMGFTMEQINEAAKACGGADRATADDLVAWIFGQDSGGETTTTAHASVKQSEENEFEETRAENESPKVTNEQREQAAAKAQKELLDAARREEEARLASERLAAKREEKRRRNREWNNREQARQKEEAKAKLTLEMERRAQVEAAQRAASERVIPHPSQLHIGTGASGRKLGIPQQVSFPPVAVPASVTVEKDPATLQNQQQPIMPAPTHILQSNGKIRPVGGFAQKDLRVQQNDYNSQRMAIPPTPGMAVDRGHGVHGNLPIYPSSFGQSPPPGLPASYGDVRVQARQEQASLPHIEDTYPVSLVATEDGTVSSAGSGIPRMDSIGKAASTPPPGFRPSQSSPVRALSTSQIGEEPNVLGEIRATAKAFVPSNFKKPSSQPIEIVNTAPAGMVPTPMQPARDFVDPTLRMSRSTSDVPISSGGFGGVEKPGMETSSLLEPMGPLLGSAALHSGMDLSPGASASSSVAGTSASQSLLNPAPVGTAAGGIWGSTGAAMPSASAPISGLPSFGFGDATSSLGSGADVPSFGAIESVFGSTGTDSSKGGASNWGSGNAAGSGNGNGSGSIW